jgi:splicing factor 3B subunit 1
VQDVDEAELSIEEAKERKIMKLLLKVKNGTPPQRKSALRQLTDKARDFGAGPLFNQILPLLVRTGMMRVVSHWCCCCPPCVDGG